MKREFYRNFFVVFCAAAAAVFAVFWIVFPNSDELKVAFLDVGQGDAVLIKTPYGQNILIDGGPDKTVERRLSEELPWRDKRIDLMVLTHPHGDHLVGLIGVMKRYEVGRILYTGVIHSSAAYRAWLEEAREKKIPVIIADRPRKIKLGPNGELNIIYPRRNLAGKTASNLNNSSVVVKLRYGETDFLFTGDIESEAKQELAGVYGADELRADVLKVAHHGSADSGNREFFEKVGAKIAVIQVGANNEFGHPDRRVVKRLERAGVRVFRTDINGTVRVASDGKEIKVLRP